MLRRAFIKAAGGFVCAGGAVAPGAHPPSDGTVPAQQGSAGGDPILGDLMRANDALVTGYLPRQERRSGHANLGGFPNEYGLHGVHDTAGFVSAAVCAACAPGSTFFQSSALVEPLQLAARHLLQAQHEDGTIDLQTTNFRSPPDTAFVIELVAPAAVLAGRARWAPLDAVLRDLRTFIVKAGGALATGGIHTPNHRWVVCAALARVHALAPDPSYVARVDQWLDEGIDIDPDGQYTERSTSVYSPIVDRALLTVARLLDRPALVEPVRRNLEMTLYYVHPDGDVATEASRRQDRYQRGTMARYYYAYRAMAHRDGDGRFAAMARLIEETARPQLTRDLPAFLEEPELQRPMPASAPLPTDYVEVFAHSALARIRRGAVSATILADNPVFFAFRSGGAALEAVRIASAFFGKGQFAGEALEQRDGRFVLRQSLEGPYYQPIPKDRLGRDGEHVALDSTGTIRTGDRALRARSNVQRLDSTIAIAERAGAFEIAIALRGTDRVPVAVELAFRRGGRLHGVEPLPAIPDAFVLKEGMGRYVDGGDAITFGPGRTEHTWTQLRGAQSKWDGQSVYLTGFTPFTLALTVARGEV